MSLAKFAKRSYQIRYIRAYLSPRLADGTYGAWQNVSRFVTENSLGSYSRSIDSNDFDIGFYEESNVTIGFDNTDARFTEGYGYFGNAQVDRSKIRLVAGYHDPSNPKSIEFETTFEGIINDQGTRLDTVNEDAVFTVLSYSGIIGRLRTDPGAVTNGQTFRTALHNLLNRPEINSLLTVSLDNINPQLNETVDNASWFAGQQLKQSINALLLASNSIFKIRDNTIYITGRTESATVRFQFFGKGASKPANVLSLTNFHNGLRRCITRVKVNNTILDANDSLISRYGATLKEVPLGFITNPVKEAAIASAVLDEFSFPKPELELTTDFLGNEIELLDLVTIDNEGTVQDEEPAIYGKAVYGQALYVRRQGGVRIKALEGFKVLGISHDFRGYTTTLKLRSIGNRPYDSNAGYSNPIYGQAIYGLSRYAQLGEPGGGGEVPPPPTGISGSPVGLFLTITHPLTGPVPVNQGALTGLFLTITNP